MRAMIKVKAERRERYIKAAYGLCPRCGKPVWVEKFDNFVVVMCKNCNIALKLPKSQVAEDHDYRVAFFDFVISEGKYAGIFTSAKKEVIDPQAILAMEEEKVRERRSRRVISDEVIQKILVLHRFTADEVADLLGVDDRTARKIIRQMRDMGLVREVERRGAKKVWEATVDVV